ncbi:MAG TPA: hypothetical protein VKZ63_05480, partial [Kofleriaceae bacterium]|nr:hypothetical protein [Kofleriaceae bacterium]
MALAAVLLAGHAASAETPLPPRGTRSVVDAAGIIPDQTEAAMEALHQELWQKAKVAIVVVT